ncbi:efflux RND transporter permease subunit [Massilia niastensis]|uniref:efflux RND transporter permease subunit n=1 Tax=Massilia niastensis TaxID=544911 RepID=UPI000361A6CE|nr:MMPL family transporter [Massilia niastensis]
MAGDIKMGREAMDARTFDPRSGNWLERLLFNHRALVILFCVLVTAGLAWQIPAIRLNASFDRMTPQDHAFIQQFKEHQADLAGQGNVLRIVVEHRKGSILDRGYLQTLQKINDEVYLVGGVDRPFMLSLWTPTMRWIGITEVGIDAGQVIDETYDGSPESLARLRLNIERSGEVGRIVAPDFRSSMLVVPLLDFDTETGKPLDYAEFSEKIENIRTKYQSEDITIRVVGFAQVAGDLIDGLGQVALFFLLAMGIATVVVYWYTRCVRSTGIVMFCSTVAVLWLLGTLPLLQFELDPYSILVPFLVFAIGISHGAQKMNGVMQDIGRGFPKEVAARYTFRRLFLAGFAALVCDAVGFAVLMLIKISVIQQLALTASIGVAFLVFTNLILLPVMLSFSGVNPAAAARTLRGEHQEQSAIEHHPLWAFFHRFTTPRAAGAAIAVALLAGAAGFWVSLGLKTGDLDPGAPELRPDSRYNQDSAYVAAHYANSSDVFIVMVTSPAEQCMSYDLQQKIDALEWELRQLPGVVATDSFASFNKGMTGQFTEGNPKWFALVPNQQLLNGFVKNAPRSLVNQPCSLSMLRIFLSDHKAETLDRVSATVAAYARKHDTADSKFLMAAGNAGIEAATNEVVRKASREMLYWVYGAVCLLCFVTFRSWRAVLCAVLPLVLTSVLAEALMVKLGIGVKVATLPVIALGVGIGVDYALYVLSIVLDHMRRGASLARAYAEALHFTGQVVLMTGVTLALGVATWVLSPIKFQADMGILLAFCFLANMLGALILLPSLAVFLLKPSRAQLIEPQNNRVTPTPAVTQSV